MRAHKKSMAYSPKPFYACRIVSGVSALIVTGILGFFCKQLVADGYKIPWTFIITLLVAVVTLVAMIFTSIINGCATLSPILNMILNIPILIGWVVSTSILTWNMYGALGHSCSIANWGNDRGVMVCQIYKTLYAFVLFASFAQIGQIVIDVRTRRQRTPRGVYDKMGESQSDIKVDALKPLAPNTVHDTPFASDTNLNQSYHDDHSYQPQTFRDESPGWKPAQRPPVSHAPSYNSSPGGYNAHHDDQYHGYESSSSMQMQDFNHQRPQPSPHYTSGNYHANDYGHQQNTYYQGRY